jgi:hypothetical protein
MRKRLERHGTTLQRFTTMMLGIVRLQSQNRDDRLHVSRINREVFP